MHFSGHIYNYLLHTSPAHGTFSYDALREISAYISHLIFNVTLHMHIEQHSHKNYHH